MMTLTRISLIGGPFDGLVISAQRPLLPFYEIRGTLLRDHGHQDLAEAFRNLYGHYQRSKAKCGITRYKFVELRTVSKPQEIA